MENRDYLIKFETFKKNPIRRAEIFKLVAPFGNITKLYITPDSSEGSIYFADLKIATFVYENLITNPLSLKLFPPIKATYISNKSAMYEDVTAGESIMYDTFGNKVEVLHDDSGEVYVPYKNIRNSAYVLYDVPPSQELPNRRVLEQFKCFLLSQSNIFMEINKQYFMPGRIIDELTSQTITAATKHSINGNRTLTVTADANERKVSENVINLYQPNEDLETQNIRRPHATKPVSKPSSEHGQSSYLSSLGVNQEKLELSKMQKVKIQHITTNKKTFFVNLVENIPLIEDIYKRVANEAARNLNVTNLKVGTICAMKIDRVWNRVCVCNLDRIQLIALETGKRVFVDCVEELRAISPGLASIPSQNICITLTAITTPPDFNFKFDSVIKIYAIKQFDEGVYVAEFKGVEVANKIEPLQKKQTVSNQNNSKPRPNETSTRPNEAITRLNEGITRPNGGITRPNEGITRPNGAIARPNETNTRPNEAITRSNEAITRPANSTPITKPVQNTPDLSFVETNKVIAAGSGLARPPFILDKDAVKAAPIQEIKPVLPPTTNGVPKSPGSAIMRAKMAAAQIKANAILFEKQRECVASNPLMFGEGGITCIKKIDAQTFDAFFFSGQTIDSLTLLDELCDKIKDAPSIIPKVGDNVALLHLDEEGEPPRWVRGFVLVVEGAQYTVAKVDYAVVDKTDDVRALPQEYWKIDEFSATCVCDSSHLAKIQEKEFYSTESKQIWSACMNVGGVSVDLTIKRWVPNLKNTASVPTNTPATPVKKAQEIITNTPRPKTELKSGEMVMLIHEEDSILYLRTRETSMCIKQIISALEAHQMVAMDSAVIINQMVLHKSDDIWRRSQVMQINGNVVNIHYIDFGNNADVPLTTLSYIEPNIASMPATLYKRTIIGHPKLTPNAIEYLKTCVKDKKFVVESVLGANEVSLTINSTKLEKILKDLDKPAFKQITDLVKLDTITVGQTVKYLIMNMDDLDQGLLALYPIEQREKFLEVQDLLETCAESCEVPLNLHPGELCIAKFEEEWFRGCIVNFDDALDKYLVYFIDFGNKSHASLDEIRVIREDMMVIGPMAILASLKDICAATNGKLTDDMVAILSDVIEIASAYEVHVISKDENDFCQVEIPVITAAAQAAHII